uniref:LRRCT domain-containing protein n=1 Tax=Cyprinus carpio TaxID=7962 RepID=A0A8C1P7Y6_CYPCA
MVISQVQLSLLCPSSCVVCSEDVIICHKLIKIIAAPGSTKALMLTDGLIDSVDNMFLSELSNMSVLALSNNAISSIMENAFQNLSFLTTLLLDHNRISSQSLDSSTFSWLHRLETLWLGHNNLNDIDGSWFQSSRALKTLQLEGNLLNCLNSTTFAHADLRNLETLDLSNNLIVYLGRDSFRGLPRLRRLDLSRNHLRSAPDAFSYLPWLSVLNLDLNLWSCTCELRELASFLNSYIQAPEKDLYNGQRMVCVNTDNAAVQAVLELTDANCVPPNRNITVEVVAKRYNTSEQYIRNVAIAIVFSFLVAIAYHKLGKKFELVQEENRVGESGLESTQWNFCEGKDTLTKCHALYNSNYKSHKPWDREDSPYLGSDMLESHFTCHKCSSTAHAVGKHKREIVLQKATHVGEQLANCQHEGNDQHSVLQQRIKGKLASTPFDLKCFKSICKGKGFQTF